MTTAEDLLETTANLVRSGKIRCWGLSSAPARYIARLATLASAHGLPGPIVMQFFCSLVNREVEDEHLPLAADAGMVPWSPWPSGR